MFNLNMKVFQLVKMDPSHTDCSSLILSRDIQQSLKAKKTHGFDSYIVISVYPLVILSNKKELQNIIIIDKLTSLLVIHNKSPRFKGRAINVF